MFADLGLPNPEARLAKAHLALEIGRILKQRKLTLQAAAKLMGIALGRDVEIVVRTPPRRRRQGRLRVVTA